MTTTDHELAEQRLIGCALIDPRVLPMVSPIVCGADFADAGLGALFDALVTLANAGKPIGDPGWLVAELSRMKIPADVRTPAAIAGFFLEVANAAHARHFADQIHRASRLRRMQFAAESWLAELKSHAADPDEALASIEGRLAGLTAGHLEDCRTIGDLAQEAIEDAFAGAKRPAAMTGLHTVDSQVGGLMPGEVTTLAARTGEGKSTLALQIAAHNAARGRHAMFVSLEMNGRELARRELAALSGIESRLLRSGTVGPDSRPALDSARENLDQLPLRIWSPPSATLAEIRARARHQQATSGLSLLVLDYLGLVRPSPDMAKRQRWEQVSSISTGLKHVAKELGVSVLSLAQLNRDADGEEPRLSHLRDSGSIEQDSDIVLMLHHPVKSPSPTGQHVNGSREAFLIVAKHRHGQTGSIRLRWIPQETRFECPQAF
jgi:replicative DNA helicase